MRVGGKEIEGKVDEERWVVEGVESLGGGNQKKAEGGMVEASMGEGTVTVELPEKGWAGEP